MNSVKFLLNFFPPPMPVWMLAFDSICLCLSNDSTDSTYSTLPYIYLSSTLHHIPPHSPIHLSILPIHAHPLNSFFQGMRRDSAGPSKGGARSGGRGDKNNSVSWQSGQVWPNTHFLTFLFHIMR
jgi:hypothetical protein